MQQDNFSKWLKEQNQSTSNMYRVLLCCRKVERYEGNLDSHFAKDKGDLLLHKLTFTSLEEEYKKPPKHSVPIGDDVWRETADLKQAVGLYFRFKRSEKRPSRDSAMRITSRALANPSYRDLLESIKQDVELLFPDYRIYGNNQEGINYITNGERIDFLLQKSDGSFMAVLVKPRPATIDMLGPLFLCMGYLAHDIKTRKIMGCLLAPEIDPSLEIARRAIHNVSFRTYRAKLELDDDLYTFMERI